ncbi:site-specific DNA-methyltransferase [Gandjariella thermophila]|nr:site-specific DNA-methyltransferase [Gandjariella thermophila]
MTMHAGLDPQVSDDGLKAEVRRGDAYDLFATLPPKSVDLILTSPPYWGLRTYDLDHNNDILQDWIVQGGTKEVTPTTS